MRDPRPWPVLPFALLALAAGPPPREHADLVVVDAHVWTVDDAHPEASAVVVRGERIVLVGTSEEARRFVGPGTRVVEAGGRLLLPGFQDGHTHFISSGMEVGQLDLKDAASPEEFGRLIAEFAKRKRPGTWITGGNWDHEKWPGGELPTAELIDRYVSDRPVFVTRYDGHMAVANTAALKAGAVTARSEDPEGGTIVRKPGGREPAGVLKDAAMGLVGKAIPAPTPAEVADAARKAFAEARRLGVTTVQDMLEGQAQLQAYETVRAEGGMTARVYGRWPVADWKWLADRVHAQGVGDDLLTLRSLKAFADGSIGSSTALFYEPYTDDAKNFGLQHDQHTHPRDFRRHVELGAIASVQPYHAIDDGRFVGKRIGRRRSTTTYAFRTFLDHGVHMNFGSDWPVAPLDPILGIDAAVNRATLDGKNPEGWFPEQKLTVAEAVRAYTLENAYAAFMEAKTGSITPGKYADFVLLDQDLLRIPSGRIKDTKVDMTVMGGKVVYERERAKR